MVATAPWFTSSIGVPALGAAPLPVSRSVAIGARAVSAFTPTFVAPRELRDLVVHALVKTISVDLHEFLFGGLQSPSFSGEAGPRRALSSFEEARGFHVSDNRELDQGGEVGQEGAQSAEFVPGSGELSCKKIAQIS